MDIRLDCRRTGLFDPSGEGTFYEDNLYTTVNGESTGSTNGINDLSIYDNKLYILIPNNQSNRSAVIACDAQTLKNEKIITADGLQIPPRFSPHRKSTICR